MLVSFPSLAALDCSSRSRHSLRSFRSLDFTGSFRSLDFGA
ncbi:hypothetical protein I547_3402 [Mycobacterium kansasii 824]|uniref:Uncharacterized protein n=1 Tax=Mycobacterium kansasii TaxID=1768 RepID=A0A1V3XJJ1_MYCKA|nr:hypothetical protein I547_3402 [Mycobacterium kansasii 824]OOK78202.1 hypothetical protein BZL30_2787 [Mycobacterium kansasii]OOK79268.1 hypothetical protein BZL30_2788 [Mycobacterium kansasii]OOK80022.1 hypothetical protein BZL29_2731 [Mycobacterium kansasii]